VTHSHLAAVALHVAQLGLSLMQFLLNLLIVHNQAVCEAHLLLIKTVV
jgi:hypothetical protein